MKLGPVVGEDDVTKRGMTKKANARMQNVMFVYGERFLTRFALRF